MHISLYLHDSADKTMDALRCRRLGVAPCCSAGCTMCRPWLPGYITGYNGVTVDPHLLPIITILTSALLHTFKQHYRRPPRSPILIWASASLEPPRVICTGGSRRQQVYGFPIFAASWLGQMVGNNCNNNENIIRRGKSQMSVCTWELYMPAFFVFACTPWFLTNIKVHGEVHCYVFLWTCKFICMRAYHMCSLNHFDFWQHDLRWEYWLPCDHTS